MGLDATNCLEQAITVERKPVLAICVGMQSLMTASEENGGVACLNQLPGEVKFFGSPHQERGRDSIESAAHGLESSGAEAGHILCGPGLSRAAISTLFTVTTWYPMIRA